MSLRSDLHAALDPAELFRQAFDLEPLDWQRDYLRATDNVVLVKGRQIGASLAAAALGIHAARYWLNTNVVIVSPSLRQSGEILGKARLGLRTLGVRLVQDSASMLRLPGGSRIISLPGSAKSVRGWTARLLILDEAAYVEPETWVAARALIATGGRFVCQSTPALEVGDFHQLATEAAEGWQRFTVRSDEVSTISPEFLAAERQAMGEADFASEYMCEFGQAGASLFTAEKLASLVLPEEAP